MWVLIGTRGARETFLQGRKGRAAKNSVDERAKQQMLVVQNFNCCYTGYRMRYAINQLEFKILAFTC